MDLHVWTYDEMLVYARPCSCWRDRRRVDRLLGKKFTAIDILTHPDIVGSDACAEVIRMIVARICDMDFEKIISFDEYGFIERDNNIFDRYYNTYDIDELNMFSECLTEYLNEISYSLEREFWYNMIVNGYLPA